MNNSFFGKSCEDVRKYKTIKFIFGKDSVKKIQRILNSVFFESAKIYGPYSAVVSLRNSKLLLDKPRYVGACILFISKIVMYEFHYDFIQPNFPGNKKIFSYIFREHSYWFKIKKMFTQHDLHEYKICIYTLPPTPPPLRNEGCTP